VIYRALFKELPFRTIADEPHFLGERLLVYALLAEKGIIYRNEPIIRNSWGKPYLKNYTDVHYNVSHCENYAACVISDTYDVGVDVERVHYFNLYAAKRVCSPKEIQRIYSTSDTNREFFRYWTLKESYIKAIGKGLSHPMKSVNFEIESDGEIRTDLSGCYFLLMEDKEGFITAVCYKEVHGSN
jgi:4'-phosphopantetheinyl transferase